jgi:murein tripeptide amidase MpaA
MPRYHVKITGKDYDAMADLVRKYKVNVARHTVEKLDKGYRVDAHADGRKLRALEAAGYKVDRYEDVDKEGKKRQKEVRKVTKKAVAAEALAVASSAHYLNVVEVEKALAAIGDPPNDPFTKLIKLPNRSWEKRVCNALKIGKGSGRERPAIYFLGGVHAREWGSPDIVIDFAQRLTKAYQTNAGITIGANNFTAAQIKNIVETKDTYVFPQCNPDGRNFSMTTDAMWRKNRRPAPPNHPQPSCVGVDINRNYDFLWNYPTYFNASSPIANSTDPCNYQTYIGPKAFSEPETKNAVWMFDQFPNIRYFIDIHSYSEDILYNWGDDENQAADPAMNFQNAAYNGKRGIAGDTVYKEYLATADKNTAVNLAKKMQTAIKNVRGRIYKLEQAMSLYPTAGTSDDYAFSRHLTDAKKGKIYSYTIEWGSPNNPTPFHPPYPEMQKIIQEITSALLAFCIAAA